MLQSHDMRLRLEYRRSLARMAKVFISRFRRKSLWLLLSLMFAQLALSGCANLARDYLRWPNEVEDQTDYKISTPKRAWVNVPQMTMVIQRDLFPYGVEQTISLPNQTNVMGDNQITLRTRQSAGGEGRLRYEEFMRRVGGPPVPFKDVNAGELLMGEDSLGPYFWAERRIGSSTFCVMALRRISLGARQLPGKADAMDVMLRNCVIGTVDLALLPIMDTSLGVARSGSGGVGGSSRLLSPLAGPSVF